MTRREELLAEMSARVAKHAGLDLPTRRWRELERKLGRVAVTTGEADSAAAWMRAMTDPAAMTALAISLTVGETYFFREPRGLNVAVEAVCDRAIRRTDQTVRIWSAGCCTGEEPFSIAILLHEKLPAGLRDACDIFASDINPNFLRKAREGRYTAWSFRSRDTETRMHLFRSVGRNERELAPDIRSRVRFAEVNLNSCAYPPAESGDGSFDVILCRNVLMYMTASAIKRIVGGFQRALKPGGILIVGTAEGHLVTQAGLTRSSNNPFVFTTHPSDRSVLQPPPKLSVIAEPIAEPLATSWASAPIRNVDAPRAERPAPVPESAIDQEYVDSEAIFSAAVAASSSGSVDSALELVAEYLQADAMCHRGHFLLACLLREKGQQAEALAALRRALYLDPNFVPALIAISSLHMERGDVPASARHRQSALEILQTWDPSEPVDSMGGLTAGRVCEMLQSVGVEQP